MVNKWQIGPVKLANGEDAFIDAINEGQEDSRYTGRIKGAFGNWVPAGWRPDGCLMRWRSDGCLMWSASDHHLNLAPPQRKTMLVRKWLVIHQNGTISLYFDRQKAIAVEGDIFALIEIDREVEEGEGL
jgi:hypothetical protein